VEIDAINEDSNTAIMLSIIENHEESLAALLAAGADLSKRNNDKQLPLCTAIKAGSYKMVKMLLAAGANIAIDKSYITKNQKNSESVVMLAVLYGDIEILKLLLLAGADAFTSGCIIGWCPLHAAAANGFTTIVKELLEHLYKTKEEGKESHEGKEDVKKEGKEEEVVEILNRETVEGWTALYIAAKYGQEEMVELVLQQKGVRVDQVDGKGLSPLMAAAEAGSSVGILRRLLQAGADMTLKDHRRNNVLHCACSKPNKGVCCTAIWRGIFVMKSVLRRIKELYDALSVLGGLEIGLG